MGEQNHSSISMLLIHKYVKKKIIQVQMNTPLESKQLPYYRKRFSTL